MGHPPCSVDAAGGGGHLKAPLSSFLEQHKLTQGGVLLWWWCGQNMGDLQVDLSVLGLEPRTLCLADQSSTD